MNINDIFPATFPALALAHFLALLSPGPDFFLIIGHASRNRLNGSGGICLGIALGNAFYICLAIAGWSGLKQSPALFHGMQIIGSSYLIWMGMMLVRSSKVEQKLKIGNKKPLSPQAQVAAGFASATLNPKNAIFYLTLMTVIIGPEATLKQQIAVGIWMATLVLVWDLALAASISLPAIQRVLGKKLYLCEKTAGVILITMALYLIFSMFL